jgi:hypothetical protein
MLNAWNFKRERYKASNVPSASVAGGANALPLLLLLLLPAVFVVSLSIGTVPPSHLFSRPDLGSAWHAVYCLSLYYMHIYIAECDVHACMMSYKVCSVGVSSGITTSHSLPKCSCGGTSTERDAPARC